MLKRLEALARIIDSLSCTVVTFFEERESKAFKKISFGRDASQKLVSQDATTVQETANHIRLRKSLLSAKTATVLDLTWTILP